MAHPGSMVDFAPSVPKGKAFERGFGPEYMTLLPREPTGSCVNSAEVETVRYMMRHGEPAIEGRDCESRSSGEPIAGRLPVAASHHGYGDGRARS